MISGIAFNTGHCPPNIALGHNDPTFEIITNRKVDDGRLPYDKIVPKLDIKTRGLLLGLAMGGSGIPSQMLGYCRHSDYS